MALAQSVAELVAGATLKWPNDLLIGRAKLAGILLERAGDAVVIGFGVNVQHHPDLPDRPATSMAQHGVRVAPEAVLELLAGRLSWWIQRWRGEGLAAVLACWRELAHPIGTALRVEMPDQTAMTGTFAGLDPGGALLLGMSDGTVRVIHAADVFAL